MARRCQQEGVRGVEPIAVKERERSVEILGVERIEPPDALVGEGKREDHPQLSGCAGFDFDPLEHRALLGQPEHPWDDRSAGHIGIGGVEQVVGSTGSLDEAAVFAVLDVGVQ